MQEQLKQKMNEEIVKLPREKQDAINSIDWGKIAEDICKQFSLTDSQTTSFQTETGLVLLGLIYPDAYVQNIEENVGVDSNQAKEMADEALNKIFAPIADKIELSIKQNIRFKNPSWKQTVNFIISGGDYSYFIGE